mmetsp:Transcript_18580/g.46362  ORF Transcript_18580/g.46362 Transcript_18580/m.46362 type:complete len:109 (-) Transcript_18580:112-438(-)
MQQIQIEKLQLPRGLARSRFSDRRTEMPEIMCRVLRMPILLAEEVQKMEASLSTAPQERSESLLAKHKQPKVHLRPDLNINSTLLPETQTETVSPLPRHLDVLKTIKT